MRLNGHLCTALAIGALVGPASAHADLTLFGNSRAFAMGGAGVAVVDRAYHTTPVNPAALALQNRRVRFDYLPGIGLRASGVPLGKAWDHLFGNPDRQDAVSLARDFGQRNSEFGVNLSWGVRFGHLDARASGLGIVRVLPNEALQTWAKNANGDVTQLTGNERADMYGAGIYSLPTIGVAERVSPAGSPTWVEAGARIRLSRAVYTHYIVSSNNIVNNTAADKAPELNGGTTLTKDGIGLDAGLLVHPRDHDGWSGALVVTNLIEPNFRFDGTDTNGAATRFDLQPRSVTVGTAWQGPRIVTAFDVVDLTRAYGNVQGRIGAEYKTRGIAVRGGYSSARGFTVGLGWGFLEFAYGARAPLEVVQTLRF